MTRQEAKALMQTINKTPGCVVNGLRKADSNFGVDVQDTQTGTPFVVWTVEQWDDRRKAATFYADSE